MALQFTGTGRMKQPQFRTDPILRPHVATAQDDALRDVFFLDMLAGGLYLARRGMVALSLPVGDAECARFVAAVEEFCASRKPLLGAA